jgi:hypothetical protein
VQKIKIAMKRLLLFSLVGIVGLLGAGKAHAQLHNMGLQMSIVNPKGDDNNKRGFNSLYGGLFYEYRFTGADIDKNELRDHFGLEFGLNYTEFIKRGTLGTLNQTDPFAPYASNKNFRSSNKGVNFYAAPKFYVTVYPELVELYVMGKAGMQYLNSSNSVGEQLEKTKGATNLFVGASLGFEVKLGTVFVGVNYGFDTNSPATTMKKVAFDHPAAGVGFNPQFKPFSNYDLWGNTVLEFKIKALLNAKD